MTLAVPECSRNNKYTMFRYDAAKVETCLLILEITFIAVGKHKASMISSCRQAIKSNNMSSLFKIIKAGVQ